MKNPRKLMAGLLFGLGILTAPTLAHATYSEMVVFGDSLSDVGNNYQSPPYWSGRYSNGPVWAEYLDAKLGLSPLAPSSQGGTDYAVGGAQTADILGQALSYIAGPGVDPKALYVVWGGANDLFNNPNPSAIMPAINNLATTILDLAAKGAKNFLVPNLPDLGLTPASSADRAGASLLSAYFNQALAAAIAEIMAEAPVSITTFDVYGLLDDAAADPGQFGFTDVTDPCIGQSSCNGYLFFDDMHPTTAGHTLLADAAAAALPEPATAFLLLIPGLIVLRRRRF